MAFQTRIRVRYQETDAMGVVYYANYLTWFEVARTEYLRKIGKTYRECEEEGMSLPVIEAGCRYFHPARYDWEIELRAFLTVAGAGFHFDYEVRRAEDGKLLATGWTDHVCTGRDGRIDRAATRRLAGMLREAGV